MRLRIFQNGLYIGTMPLPKEIQQRGPGQARFQMALYGKNLPPLADVRPNPYYQLRVADFEFKRLDTHHGWRTEWILEANPGLSAGDFKMIRGFKPARRLVELP